MGIIEKARRMVGGSKERFECKQDQSGKVMCRSFRENPDNTRIELAGIDFEFTASPECRPISTQMWENEPGALERLEKKSVNRLKQKCTTNTNKPSDF